jgi:hypothetical protein
MPGRPKKRVYEYDRNGKFLRTYDSQQEVFDAYYEGKKRPLIREGKEFAVTPAGTYVSNYRIGREKLRVLNRIENSKYVAQANEKRVPEDCYNLAGERIASFRSVCMASRLTGISLKTISAACESNPQIYKKYSKKHDLLFRYSE